MDLHHLFPICGIKNHLFRLNFSGKHLTNLFFVYATLMTLLSKKTVQKAPSAFEQSMLTFDDV